MTRKKATARPQQTPVRDFRDDSTDDAIVAILASNGGDVNRREIVRALGHRGDMASALGRLERKGTIELVATQSSGARATNRVRLIGDMAVQKGAGYVRVGGKP